MPALSAHTLRGDRRVGRAGPDVFLRGPGGPAIDSLAFLPNGRAVVTGMNDGTLLVWDLARETWPKVAVHDLGRKELDALWSDLAADARKAHRAACTLADSPAQALPFLAAHLRPIAAIDPKRVDRLLADLDSEQFSVRDAAARELEGMGEQIEPTLRRVLESKPPLEVRNRLQTIRDALRGVPPRQSLRTLRAISVLERIGTAEARDTLRTLAGGAAAARETREALAALPRRARAERAP